MNATWMDMDSPFQLGLLTDSDCIEGHHDKHGDSGLARCAALQGVTGGGFRSWKRGITAVDTKQATGRCQRGAHK